MIYGLNTLLTAVIAIFVFGTLILIHEFGHFIAAKKFGVKVNEFAIGMGPTIWSTQKGETTYALRALPVGGFVSMEGEEEGENPDSRAFCNKKPWQRLIIMAAGPAMNLLLGYLIVLGLTASGNAIATPVIHSFDADAVTSQYFEPGAAKLLEYLGYGNFYKYAYSKDTTWKTDPLVSNLELNLYGVLAYQKIYADHIRDSQWERVSPSTFNVDYLDGSNMFVDVSSDSSFINNYSFFDLRYCNWQKDMFHGVVPRAQYGDVAAVPVESLPVVGEQPESAISILVLRQMEFLQRWKEITQSGNKDYKEQIEKHPGHPHTDRQTPRAFFH